MNQLYSTKTSFSIMACRNVHLSTDRQLMERQLKEIASWGNLDCVYTMSSHSENGENRDGKIIFATVQRMPEKSENGRKFDVKNSLQGIHFISLAFMPKKCTYFLRINQSRSESVAKCSVFRVLDFSHDTVFKIYRPKICCFCVNGRPIHDIFHRFQMYQHRVSAVSSSVALRKQKQIIYTIPRHV